MDYDFLKLIHGNFQNLLYRFLFYFLIQYYCKVYYYLAVDGRYKMSQKWSFKTEPLWAVKMLGERFIIRFFIPV